MELNPFTSQQQGLNSNQIRVSNHCPITKKQQNVKQSHQSLSLTNASSPSEVLPPNHRSLFSLPSKNPKNGWCESETTTFHLQYKNVQISANIATRCNNNCQYAVLFVMRIHFQSTQILSWTLSQFGLRQLGATFLRFPELPCTTSSTRSAKAWNDIALRVKYGEVLSLL